MEKEIENDNLGMPETPTPVASEQSEPEFPPENAKPIELNLIIGSTTGANQCYCPKHPEILSSHYCVQCRIVICETCKNTEHSEHKSNSLNEAKDYQQLSYVQRQIIETEKRLVLANKELNNLRAEVKRQQIILSKDRRMEELMISLYTQCLQFVNTAKTLVSPIPIVTVF